MDDSQINVIRRLGKRLRWVALGVMLLIPLVAGGLVVLKGPLALIHLPAGIELDAARLTPAQSLAAVGVGLITPAVYLVGMAMLYRLFGLYAEGTVFAEENVRLMRRAGYAVIAIDAARILQSALAGPVLTAVGAVDGYLAIDLQISMLVVGLFIVAIGHVMDLGRTLYESDRLTI